MSVVTVQELGQSQGGKPKCKANNVWYFLPTDRDTGTGASPAVGQVIEIRTGSFQMGDKTFQTIEAWRPAGQSPAQAQQQSAGQRSAAPTVQAQKPVETSQAFIGQGFISNVVGTAINAGLIKEPGQILPWFNGAKAALEGKAAPEPFNDNIPFGDEPKQAQGGRW